MASTTSASTPRKVLLTDKGIQALRPAEPGKRINVWDAATPQGPALSEPTPLSDLHKFPYHPGPYDKRYQVWPHCLILIVTI